MFIPTYVPCRKFIQDPHSEVYRSERQLSFRLLQPKVPIHGKNILVWVLRSTCTYEGKKYEFPLFPLLTQQLPGSVGVTRRYRTRDAGKKNTRRQRSHTNNRSSLVWHQATPGKSCWGKLTTEKAGGRKWSTGTDWCAGNCGDTD